MGTSIACFGNSVVQIFNAWGWYGTVYSTGKFKTVQGQTVQIRSFSQLPLCFLFDSYFPWLTPSFLDYSSKMIFPWYSIVAGVCNFLGSVSLQQKFEATDGPALQPRVISSDGSVLQPHVTAQFYLERKGKYILEVWGRTNPKDMKRKPLAQFWLLFLYVFPPPRGPALVNWASQECCLFYPRSSGPLTFVCSIFCGLSPSLAFSHHHLDSFFLF